MPITPSNGVVVLGANGRLGAALVQAFAARGWRVWAQLRRPPPQPLPAHATALTSALADTEALAARAAGARVVVYAVNPPYWRWDEELLPLMRQGTALARRLGAVFMLPGNVYNYGATSLPRWIDDRTPQQPGTRKGVLRVQMERELHALAQQGLASVIIRAGDFFGTGSGTWLDQAIAKDLARGRIVYPGPLDRAHAWAYLPDLAQAFVAVAEQPRVGGCRVLQFGGHTLTGAQFVAALQAASEGLGLRPAGGWRVRGLPWPLLRVAGLVRPMLRELVRMNYLWRVPHGLTPTTPAGAATPIEAALRATLRAQGLVPAPGALSSQREPA